MRPLFALLVAFVCATERVPAQDAAPPAGGATAPPTSETPPPAAAHKSPEAMARWEQVPERARTQPDAVLVWGRGLYRVDLATGEVTQWLDDSHVVEKVCWMSDSMNHTDSVFVVEQGQVARLYADSGLTVPGSSAAGAVTSRHVLDLAASGNRLTALELDRMPDGSGSGRPFWASDFADPTSPIALETQPDRLCFNGTLDERGAGGEVFVDFASAEGLGPRLWNTHGEAPRPQPQPADQQWFAQGFAMAADVPRGFALLVSGLGGSSQLMACNFKQGLASGIWSELSTRGVTPEAAIMSLYLCTPDGRRVLVGNGVRLALVDGSSGSRLCSLDLKGVAPDSEAVVDACLVELPHSDGRHRFEPKAPGDLCLRDAAWICGLVRSPAAPGAEPAMHLAVWELQTGALVKLLDAPSGVTQVTTLTEDVTRGL